MMWKVPEGKIPLLVIEGATSAGKSDIAVRAASALSGEVIGADSMQVYRGMDIGTGKIRPEETAGVPHHLIDVADPENPMDLAVYKEAAKEAIRRVWKAGHLPVLCGGTGFYIQAVIRDVDFSQGDPAEEYRQHLENLASSKGNEALHRLLAEVDPVSAEKIHQNNVKRMIRALEYFHETGRPLSEKNEEDRALASPYDHLVFWVDRDRDTLYRRIDARVDKMLKEGLIDEVRALKDRGLTEHDRAMQALGYKEILRFLDGVYSLDEAVRVLKRDTRHFAKRQLTWFRHDGYGERITFEDHGGSAEKVAEEIIRRAEERWT